jgi:hypothetical protein
MAGRRGLTVEMEFIVVGVESVRYRGPFVLLSLMDEESMKDKAGPNWSCGRIPALLFQREPRTLVKMSYREYRESLIRVGDKISLEVGRVGATIETERAAPGDCVVTGEQLVDSTETDEEIAGTNIDSSQPSDPERGTEI